MWWHWVTGAVVPLCQVTLLASSPSLHHAYHGSLVTPSVCFWKPPLCLPVPVCVMCDVTTCVVFDDGKKSLGADFDEHELTWVLAFPTRQQREIVQLRHHNSPRHPWEPRDTSGCGFTLHVSKRYTTWMKCLRCVEWSAMAESSLCGQKTDVDDGYK